MSLDAFLCIYGFVQSVISSISIKLWNKILAIQKSSNRCPPFLKLPVVTFSPNHQISRVLHSLESKFWDKFWIFCTKLCTNEGSIISSGGSNFRSSNIGSKLTSNIKIVSYLMVGSNLTDLILCKVHTYIADVAS